MSLTSYTSPVITGHRGFKSKYTENSLTGFKKCYETGATVIETDLWLSSDNEIIISHDMSTKRIFVHSDGSPTDYNVLQTSYQDVLRHLKTIGDGSQLMTFRDVLGWFKNYVDTNGSNVHKLQLDIKRYNPTKLLKYIIKDLLAVHDDIQWWFHRIQFGIWDLSFLKYLNQDDFFKQHFTGALNKFGYKQFDIFHISISWRDSINYINYNFYLDALDEVKKDSVFRFRLTGVSLIYISTWSTDFITKFIPLLRIQNLKLYSWTINTTPQFDYLVKIGKTANLPEYGIITDYPDVMVAHKDETEEDESNKLVTELSRLSSYSTCSEAYDEDGKLNIDLSLKQKIVYLLYTGVQALSYKRISAEERKFDSYVDENQICQVKISPVFQWIFQTCQKYGVF